MLQEILLGSLFVIGTVALVALAYFAMRWLASHLIEDHTKDLAGSVIFRVSALHGLILALIFAQQMQGYQQLKAEVVAEATAIADIYNDIRRFDPEIAPSIQTSLARYLNVVVGEEWESIGAGRGTVGGAWQQWEAVYHAILDLKPSNPRQDSLRDHMLEDVQKIAEVRDQRQHQNAEAVSRYFWFAAISGIFLVSLAYFCFPPTIPNLTLLCIFGAFTGIVMFFIYAFSNPYSPPGALDPNALQHLLDGEIGNALRG